MARPLISENQICESGGYKKQDQHYDRHDIADHETVQTGAPEGFSVSFHFTDDPVRSDHPADQNTGQEGDERHQEAVAEIVHNIEQLCDGSVWKLQLKIKLVVTKTDQYGSNE